jgi:hypothetical protein
VTATAPFPTGQNSTAGAVECRISEMRTRAGHPQGYRLFDYRPDLLALTGCLQSVLAIHRPQPADESTAQTGAAEVWCQLCLQAWPCPTVDAIAGALGTDCH